LVEHFVANHMPTLRPASQRPYADEPAERITGARLVDFEAKRRPESPRSQTIRRHLFCLSSIFTGAIDWE
jgi:hypothetical protein